MEDNNKNVNNASINVGGDNNNIVQNISTEKKTIITNYKEHFLTQIVIPIIGCVICGFVGVAIQNNSTTDVLREYFSEVDKNASFEVALKEIYEEQTALKTENQEMAEQLAKLQSEMSDIPKVVVFDADVVIDGVNQGTKNRGVIKHNNVTYYSQNVVDTIYGESLNFDESTKMVRLASESDEALKVDAVKEKILYDVMNSKLFNNNVDSFTFAGKEYTAGVMTNSYWAGVNGSKNALYFNTEGNYSTLSFDVGAYESKSGDVEYKVYIDGEYANKFTTDHNSVYKHYDIDINYAQSVVLSVDSGGSGLAFVNIYLTK